MAKPVAMPKLGITVESALLSKWHKSVGEHIAVGEVLFSCETDKAAFDQESEFEGTVLAILYKSGEIVPVFSTICVIGNPDEDISMFSTNVHADAQDAMVETKIESTSSTISDSILKSKQDSKIEGNVVMTPRAHQLASKLGIHKEECIATGPKNRIVEMDVRRASVNEKVNENIISTRSVEQQSSTITYREAKLTNIRKIIAKNMMYSLSSMAQLTHSASFDCSKILTLRAAIKTMAAKGMIADITLNDMVIYAVSRVLKKHKDLNAHLVDNDTMRYFDSVNIGIATDTSRGLMVPTLFGADSLSLEEISKQASVLIQSAQSGGINPSLLTGGTFTISNLGSLGVEHFTPVINPPQTGILGVNTIDTKIKVGKDGSIIPYQSMGLSLTYDHRAIDGAPASRFLKDLKEFLEVFPVDITIK